MTVAVFAVDNALTAKMPAPPSNGHGGTILRLPGIKYQSRLSAAGLKVGNYCCPGAC
ncbi:hypothetical protein KCP70_21075 [Salmonella enterica subsp. enterica]|nr:hypothetical protein KCP70_21075 [Salmonella enterica subsp. enterica]